MSGGHGHEAPDGHDDHGHAPAASSGGGGGSGIIGGVAGTFIGMFDAIINGPFK